ncbi:hypothetical protein [Weissella soli]|jgi:hypothetical protein|uniref:Uncharacterized protein n=1 Tax=Weissella soli TaxID=155866 RepID=A0A288QNQ6_9LACO|nr:hypothetical protein [Weissella soli]AOT56846.1 hypothetical protein WSWS_01238 [Weissella soli]MCT8395499.1 hypothetical protein [Weissella soli]NKY83297.1 hypothetical protein [Weissella soli]RDL05411.1 hypothetical protein DFP99_1372 [Weissella soli]GEN93548.1 hypothetical protein WSO01_11600 [Weissella soli]
MAKKINFQYIVTVGDGNKRVIYEEFQTWNEAQACALKLRANGGREVVEIFSVKEKEFQKIVNDTRALEKMVLQVITLVLVVVFWWVTMVFNAPMVVQGLVSTAVILALLWFGILIWKNKQAKGQQ